MGCLRPKGLGGRNAARRARGVRPFGRGQGGRRDGRHSRPRHVPSRADRGGFGALPLLFSSMVPVRATSHGSSASHTGSTPAAIRLFDIYPPRRTTCVHTHPERLRGAAPEAPAEAPGLGRSLGWRLEPRPSERPAPGPAGGGVWVLGARSRVLRCPTAASSGILTLFTSQLKCKKKKRLHAWGALGRKAWAAEMPPGARGGCGHSAGDRVVAETGATLGRGTF